MKDTPLNAELALSNLVTFSCSTCEGGNDCSHCIVMKCKKEIEEALKRK